MKVEKKMEDINIVSPEVDQVKSEERKFSEKVKERKENGRHEYYITKWRSGNLSLVKLTRVLRIFFTLSNKPLYQRNHFIKETACK